MNTKYILLLLLCIFSFQANAQTEEFVEKYDNGQIKSIYHRNKAWGFKEGSCINYTKDGTLYSELNYQEGKLHGTLKFYNEFGKIEAIINYDRGIFEGKSTMYHPIQSADETPAIYFTQMYHNGKLNGMTYEYDKKGKNIIRRARYHNGICMADTIISDKGITYKYREYESEYDDELEPMTTRFVPFKKKSATANKSMAKPQKKIAIARSNHSSSTNNKTSVSRKTTPAKPTETQATIPEKKPRLKLNKDGVIEFE